MGKLRPRIRRVIAGFAIASASLVLTATQASAHSELISSDPAEGATLHKSPTKVSLTFGEPIQEDGSTIVVTGYDENAISDDSTFKVNGTVASVAVAGDQKTGDYVVAYRILSADGHIVEDSYTYHLDVALPSASASTDTPSPTATADPTTSPVSSDTSDDSSAGGVWVLGLGAIAIALVAAIVSVLMRRRRD
ncbi:MAG TPA: copper resistance CopC family protein [Actinomycetes bacterium]|nr:copper resistance CopC family protein [Actinomycetes bacterium]